jgi:hypothetical protein
MFLSVKKYIKLCILKNKIVKMLALTPSFQNKQLFFLPKKDKNTKHL